MGVFKRGTVYYARFRYKDPVTGHQRQFYRSTGQASKAEALEIEARWRLEVRKPPEPVKPAPKSAAFSGFALHWLKTYVEPTLKPTTARSYRKHLRTSLVPFFGHVDLRLVDAERIETYKAAQLEAGLAPKTINNALGCLSSMFERALIWRYVEANPVRGVKPLQLPPAAVRFYTREQSDRFLAAVRPRWRTLFLCALRSGLRQGELFALEWSDLELGGERPCIHVRRSYVEGRTTTPKSGRARVVPIPSDLAAELRRHPRRLDSELVFPSGGDKPLTNSCIWRPMRHAQKVAALDRISFHDLRHSYASQLVMEGVPLKAVQEYLGHAHIQTTMRYAHLSPSSRADFVEVLARPNPTPDGLRERHG